MKHRVLKNIRQHKAFCEATHRLTHRNMLHKWMHTDNQIWLVFMKGLSKPSADDGGVALLVIHEENVSIKTLA